MKCGDDLYLQFRILILLPCAQVFLTCQRCFCSRCFLSPFLEFLLDGDLSNSVPFLIDLRDVSLDGSMDGVQLLAGHLFYACLSERNLLSYDGQYFERVFLSPCLFPEGVASLEGNIF